MGASGRDRGAGCKGDVGLGVLVRGGPQHVSAEIDRLRIITDQVPTERGVLLVGWQCTTARELGKRRDARRRAWTARAGGGDSGRQKFTVGVGLYISTTLL